MGCFKNIYENNHVPETGLFKCAVVEDHSNGLFYVYDSCGDYSIIDSSNRSGVTSVNGKSGVVVLDPDDLDDTDTDHKFVSQDQINDIERISNLPLSVKDFGAVGDGVADDTVAIQAAITAADAGDTIYFPAGKYLTSAPIVVKREIRLHGDSWGAAVIINTTSDVFDMSGPAGLIDRIEIDHLGIDVTNGHAFNAARLIRSSFHHLNIIVRSADKAVWNAPAVKLMIECYFSDIQYRVYGATRTIAAWNLISDGIDLITANVWQRVICWNNDYDNTQYQFDVRCIAPSGSNRANMWRDIVFEQCCGGAIYLENSTNSVIENCYSWDTPASSITQPIFRIAKNPGNSQIPTSNTITNSGRVGDGLATGVYDLVVSTSALQTTIIGFSARGTGVVPRISLGGSAGATLLNVQRGSVIDGISTASYIKTEDGTTTSQPATTQDGYIVYNRNTDTVRSSYRSYGVQADTSAYSAGITGEALRRYIVRSDGEVSWGDGTNPHDISLRRTSSGSLRTEGKFVAWSGISIGTGTPAPTSSSSPGQRGDIAYDANYMYICVLTNTWRRVALSTF